MKGYEPLVEKYSRQAAYYDRRWNLRWGEATLRAAIDAVPWNELGRVLDVGCGTGALEQAVKERLGATPPENRPGLSLVGSDLSLPMLQLARQKVDGTRRISWANAPAEQLPFASGAFDGLICNNSFHYYRQAMPVLREFHRVLRPQGQLVLVDWCNDFLTNRLSYWVLRLAHHTHIHRYSLSRVYGLKEFEGLLQAAGFRVGSAETVPMDWGWGVMVVKARA
jgi:ubiquinone/menaquinone biosynthesis C-methylase UbiE